MSCALTITLKCPMVENEKLNPSVAKNFHEISPHLETTCISSLLQMDLETTKDLVPSMIHTVITIVITLVSS